MASTSNTKPNVFAGKNINAKPTAQMYAAVTSGGAPRGAAAKIAASRLFASSATRAAAPFAGLTMTRLPALTTLLFAAFSFVLLWPSHTSATCGTPDAWLVAFARADAAPPRTPPITTELGLKSSEKTFARWSPLEPATTSPRSEPHTNTSPPAITSEFWSTSPRTCACGKRVVRRVSRRRRADDEKKIVKKRALEGWEE